MKTHAYDMKEVAYMKTHNIKHAMKWILNTRNGTNVRQRNKF